MRSFAILSILVTPFVMAACSSGSAPNTGVVEVAPPAAEPASQPAPATTAAAAIPVTQADRGRDTFLQSCTACHASGEFSASSFRGRWHTRNAADLYLLISNTMPEDAPSSLAPERYLAIVAYILTLNGFESSAQDGPWDMATLERISLAPMGGG